MAHVYVRSSAAGAGTGADWTNAYTTLNAAFAAKAAGDQFWLADDHAQTQATALTLTSPGTAAAPCTVICVNRAGSVPPVSADLRTTATITTTGASAMTFDGTCWYQGTTFNAGTGAVASGIQVGLANNNTSCFKNCALKKLGTVASNSAIKFTGAIKTILDNTSMAFGHVDDAIWMVECNFTWRNTATPVTGTFPGILFGINQSIGVNLIEGVDFSAAGFSGGYLVGANGYSLSPWVFQNCKFHASLNLGVTPSSHSQSSLISLVNDSTASNYKHSKISYAGTQTTETTIVRTGGATDGWAALAWKIITTANNGWLFPFETLPMAIPNDTIGANVTVTIYGVWGGGAVPTNRDIWPEISYMGSSGSPIATIVSGGAADYLATAINWATDSSTWGGSTTKFKMAVTLSSPQPALRGPIYVTVKAAKASDTFYIDPKPVLS